VFEVRVFDLPTLNDRFEVIEDKFCELTSKYRNGERLDRVELDWMDSANSWLISYETLHTNS
jgi:hypothetical protein